MTAILSDATDGYVFRSDLRLRPDASVTPARLSMVNIDPLQARGPCWARSLAMSLYAGEDWFFQIDSHMDFDPHWDERLITQQDRGLAGQSAEHDVSRVDDMPGPRDLALGGVGTQRNA